MAEPVRKRSSTPKKSSVRKPAAAGSQPRPGTARETQDAFIARAAGRKSPGRADRALELSRICARIAFDNRAKDIAVLDLREVNAIVDFFVVATVASRRQAGAIAVEIDREMKKQNERKIGIEGAEEGRWVLMDYGDFVVHVFLEEARLYYSIEDIWGDAPRLDPELPALPQASAPFMERLERSR